MRATVGAVVLVALGVIATMLWRQVHPPESFAQRIAPSLKATQAKLSDKARNALISDYLAASPHRAFALAPREQSHWWTADWATPEIAADKVLERCQLAFGEPCVLLAVDEDLAAADTSGARPARDMPRSHFEGACDPSQLPAVRTPVMSRADVVGYRNATGPKAGAIHPRGVFAISTGAATQRKAELQALKVCNADAARHEADGPCLLYAAGDQVVVNQRMTTPIAKP